MKTTAYLTRITKGMDICFFWQEFEELMRTSRLLSSVSVTTKYEFFLSKKVDDPLRFYRDPSIQKTCLKNENTYLVTSAVFEVVRKSIFPVVEFFKGSSNEEMLNWSSTEGFTQELLPLHALIFSILAIPFDSFKSIKSSIELEVTFFAARK